MSDDALKAIYNKALDIISRREHSQKELTGKLLNKFSEEELVESAINSLVKKNLLNDFRYTEAYVVSRKRKGFGPKKIIYELIARGVMENIAYEAIENEGGWKDAALKAFNKKFKKGKAMDFKELNKQKAFLQNRGFSFEEIDSVFT
jgi:regulatory protein